MGNVPDEACARSDPRSYLLCRKQRPTRPPSFRLHMSAQTLQHPTALTARIFPALPLLLLMVGSHHGLSAQLSGEGYLQPIPGTELSFAMAHVPAGTFLLGSPPGEVGRDDDEGPQRTVILEAFWIAVQEVTQAEYGVFRQPTLDRGVTSDPERRMDVDAVSRPSPPYADPAHGMGAEDHPATGMTQWAALQYARWLSEKTGRLYRLPTEAEWEYACRAGTTSARPPSQGPAGMEDGGGLEAMAWFIDNSGEVTHPVGRKEANPWGVHDMLGNVAEWTLDFYRADFYETLPEPARAPWSRSEELHPRTVRGGAFDDLAADVRCADRLESTLRWKRRDPQLPQSRWWNTDSPHVGLRLVHPMGILTIEEIRAYWDDLMGPAGAAPAELVQGRGPT